MPGNSINHWELLTYPDSTAVEAVLVLGGDIQSGALLDEYGLWVLPKNGKQAYGYKGYSRNDWEIALTKTGQSAGQAWAFTKKRAENTGKTTVTCSHSEFYAKANWRPIEFIYPYDSKYAF